MSQEPHNEGVPWYGDIEDEPDVAEPEDPMYTDQPGLGNGVDALTGDLLTPIAESRALAEHVVESPPPAELDESSQERGRALPPDVEWNDLTQTGWGVIVRKGAGEEALRGLRGLLDRREEQAGWMFRRFEYEPGESARRFLARHNLGPGVVDPEVVPYYLLIAGGPEEVPFWMQYQLGIGYGVGRLHFDSEEGYRRYAEGVLRTEDQGTARPRSVSLFSVATDPTTERMTADVVGPLVPRLVRRGRDWVVRTVIRDDAERDRLQRLLGGDETPTLVLANCHGVAYPCGHAQQAARQGALICHGWPGPGTAPTDDHLFTAADVPDGADVRGLVCMLLACHSAATPQQDHFPHEKPGPRTLATESFVAALPKRLLGHPGGGALGVIGHVDRAWTTSGIWTQRGGQVQTLAAVMRHVLAGHRLGHAMSLFGQRHAAIATQLSEVWDQVRRGGARPSDRFLAWLWTAHNDARNMILLGDPAARSPVAGAGSGA